MVAAGETLTGRYRLDRPVGQGACARVYLATDLLLRTARLQRRVAVKLLHPELVAQAGDRGSRARFKDEARVIATLAHPTATTARWTARPPRDALRRRRGAPGPAARRPEGKEGGMTRRVLYLVRHGQYDATATPADGDGGGLTPLGREQATLTAAHLRALPISVIHHSTLRRAAETARALAAELPGAALRPSALLRECIPAVPPDEALPPAARAFFARLSADTVARGAAQADEAFRAFFAPPAAGAPGDGEARHEMLVCHGNLIGYLVCQVLGAPAASWWQTKVRLCGISEVEVGGEHRAPLLVGHNDTGHLPPHLRAYA